MTTLYASDLDGTLLGADAHISTYSQRMLSALASKGVNITYITARTPATVEPIMQAVNPSLPAVVMTGAAIWLPDRRQYHTVHYHSASDVLQIIDICRRHGVTPFVYTLERGSNSLVVYHEAALLTDIEHTFVVERTLNDLKTFHLHTPMPQGHEDIVVLFFAMGDPASIRAVAEDIRLHTRCYASWYPDTYHHGLSLLEVFTEGVSKAAGLRALKELTQADTVVAFGDNLNDIPMLQAADRSVAVENAHPDVRAIADIVIGRNTDDAVPRFIAEDSNTTIIL